MLAQTCPMTTLTVVNVDAVGRPWAPSVQDHRNSETRAGHVYAHIGQRRSRQATQTSRTGHAYVAGLDSRATANDDSGPGRPKRCPCPYTQPSASIAAAWCAFSMPSATTLTPIWVQMVVMDRHIAAPRPVPAETNERSSLTTSTGSACSWASAL